MKGSNHHLLRLVAVAITSTHLVLGQSCTDTTCTTNCAMMDTPIAGCLGHWQSRGKTSLSQCVCTYHDHTIALLSECVACNNPNLVVSEPLGAYQAWYELCTIYQQQGEQAAVAREPDGINGLLVPVFSQTHLGLIQTSLCRAAVSTTISTTTPSTTSQSTTPTHNAANSMPTGDKWSMAVMCAGFVAEMII